MYGSSCSCWLTFASAGGSEEEIRRLRRVGSCARVADDHNCKWATEIFKEVGDATDRSVEFLRYLLFSFMTGDMWNTIALNADIGGSNANIRCSAT